MRYRTQFLIPQPLNRTDSPTFGNLTLTGATLSTPSGTNLTLAPGGTAGTRINTANTKLYYAEYAADSYGRLFIGASATTPTSANSLIASNGSNVYISAVTSMELQQNGSQRINIQNSFVGVGSVPFLVNGLGVVGTGAIQFPTTYGSGNGLTFAANLNFYPESTSTVVTNAVSGDIVSKWSKAGTGKFQIQTSGNDIYLDSLTAGASVILRTGNQATALSLDSAQNQTLVGNFAGAANKSITVGGAASAAATATKLTKAVTAIANAAATAVLTVTIPNAAHSADLTVTLVGSLGAGGAVGANEATASIAYDFAIARTAGVNAAVTISAAYSSAAAAVAGAATVTVTAAASAISGAVGATNTFTVNVTISRGSGASTNHTCLVVAELMNANATGITIA